MPFVILQFILMILLAVPWRGWPTAPNDASTLLACALLVAGVALFFWVLRHNPIGNFSYRPAPPSDNRLITSGPYRHIRHPMYLALLLVLLAAVLFYGEAWRWLAWLALTATLHFKSRLEERLLITRFPEYPAYKARTKSILPFIL